MATCRGCGKRIIWGLQDDKPIPLDPTPAVYRVLKHDASGAAVIQIVPLEEGERTHMVTHFATCPKASQFSGRNR